jgi:hypothetical protein
VAVQVTTSMSVAWMKVVQQMGAWPEQKIVCCEPTHATPEAWTRSAPPVTRSAPPSTLLPSGGRLGDVGQPASSKAKTVRMTD